MIYRVDRTIEQLVDEILVIDCQSGSVKALEMLVSRWQKRLWQYAYNLTSDADASWDITQEGWLSIIKGLRKLQDPACFKGWAYRIITNKSIDWLRKNRSVKRVGLEQMEEHQSRPKKDTGLKELLDKLEVGKKVILSLYYFEELSVSEIGAALKIPNGTVKSRLYNARRELKELYRRQIE
jgi:RNA polymerase sigma-70 factor (ECF subfamily)